MINIEKLSVQEILNFNQTIIERTKIWDNILLIVNKISKVIHIEIIIVNKLIGVRCFMERM